MMRTVLIYLSHRAHGQISLAKNKIGRTGFSALFGEIAKYRIKTCSADPVFPTFWSGIVVHVHGVKQVGNGTFKVHKSVLANYSSVMEVMVNCPKGSGLDDGTEENPLILDGDSVRGWELLLRWQYDW
jgi:hypothetical protein